MSITLDGEYLTVAEAAALLKVSQSTIWRWINNGELAAYRIGHRRVLLKRADLLSMVTPARMKAEEHQVRGLEVPGSLTKEEQERMLNAIEDAKRLQEEQLRRRGGKPYPSSTELIHEMREERMRELE